MIQHSRETEEELPGNEDERKLSDLGGARVKERRGIRAGRVSGHIVPWFLNPDAR